MNRKHIALPLAGLALVGAITVSHVHTSSVPATEVSAAQASTTSVLPADDEIRELKRASRSRRVVPAPSPSATHVVVAKPRLQARVYRSQPALVQRPSTDGCTLSNWRSTLGSDELWIDERESGVNPNNRNPSSGAYGLGQLLPSTYADLGVPMTSNPCDQIQAQRKYMRGRYGSWGNARAFWESHSWW